MMSTWKTKHLGVRQPFLAHVVLPNGETVFQAVTPEIAECYKTGNQPKLLLGSGL